MSALGTAPAQVERLSAEDLALLRYVAAVLEAGLPLVALLQLVRVYGQAMARVADAEVRLFHMYVHEPLMRSGATGLETADEMLELTRRLLPLASPVMDQVHQRYLQHFVEQDVVGHMESDLEGDSVDLGRMRVAIAFADLDRVHAADRGGGGDRGGRRRRAVRRRRARARCPTTRA